MKKKQNFILIALLLILLSACNLQTTADDAAGGQQQTIEAQVAATLAAMETAGAPTAEPTPQPTVPTTGTIQGSLSFPSEFLPPQHVVAFRVGTDEWYDVTTLEGQTEYEITGLPPGTYFVVAYLTDAATPQESINLSGAYTQAVPCGLSVDCMDHALVNVEVTAGSTVTGVNPQDWYAAPEERTWPSDPALGDLPDPGSISGNLAFPSEFLPAQHVVAFRVGTDEWYDTTTDEGQGVYTISDLPAGDYFVAAYLTDAESAQESLQMSAAYTQAVPCSLSVDCTDHSLITVSVGAGQALVDIDPVDWYVAPEEKSWPADPTLPEAPEVTGISGMLSYPGEVLPPQRVVAFDVNDPNTYYLTEVREGQAYTLETPPGSYIVVAYLIDPAGLGAVPGLAGGYSQAVICGLQVDCNDHSLAVVEVAAGERVEGVDPGDWYLPPRWEAWPADPTVAATGVISGTLAYPSSYIPPLRVVAFDVNSDWYYYVETVENQGQYQIADLPVGTYHVVAFVKDDPTAAGAYSAAVPCGLSADCTDHALLDVLVYPGQTVTGISPADFYADPNAWNWPGDPTQ